MLRNKYREPKTKYELWKLTICISNVLLLYRYFFHILNKVNAIDIVGISWISLNSVGLV